ncbi:MAG: glycoside hydrolase family 95 protein, partial [Bacteroidia bacterium]|nr:glycoside hydrolase family 95 protein [Bacteroidia bacterium]
HHAREMYGCRGWTMHHVTDIFGRTGVHDGIRSGMFPMGGPWMTFPIWRHYEFMADQNYLESIAWPIMKGSAEFILDFLTESPEGYLVTNPSYSPENAFVHPQTGQPTQLTYAPAMDIQIIRQVFQNCLEAGKILNRDPELLVRIRQALTKLPPQRIGRDSTLQEWIHDYPESEPGHRHISHLLALYPGNQIHQSDTAFFEAARQTIKKRLTHGGGHTGWSRAWIINFYARLLDGDQAYEHILALLRKSTHKNLFDDHPPFQIDGNFGGTAGVAEMLLQSHQGVLHLLPALPHAWPQGEIRGIRGRGGYEIDIAWREGKLAKVTLRPSQTGTCRLRYGEQVVQLGVQAGQVYYLNDQLEPVGKP